MDLSIIIVSWNVKELLKKCLQSIYDKTQGIDFEVIVIDNASTDCSCQMVTQNFRQVNLIAADKNLGFSKANNLGLHQAKGKYILFMNPDMEITENSFIKLIELMDSDNKIALCTCQLIYPDNHRQNNIKNNPGLCDQLLILLKLHHIWQPDCLKKYLAKDFDYSKEQEVKQIMGAFILSKAEIIRRIGGWDEDFYLWWEDLDLCKRIQNLGLKIVYTPITKVIHHEGQSFNQQMSVPKQKRFNRGMAIYFKKHNGLIAYSLVYLANVPSLLLAFISQLFKIKPKSQSKI